VKCALKKQFNDFVKLVQSKIESVLEDPQKLEKKKSMKFIMFVEMNHNQVFELLQRSVPFQEQQEQ
jgi:hypothetical protein